VLHDTDPQAGLTLWRCCWPEVKRLSAELVKIDAYLDDERPTSAAVGGGGLEWPQEGVVDQYRSLPGRDRDGRVIGPVASTAALTGVDQVHLKKRSATSTSSSPRAQVVLPLTDPSWRVDITLAKRR
jgi:hypothetical protein